MGNCTQNNPGRIKTIKSTCNKDLKSKIFLPSKAAMPTITEITFFVFHKTGILNSGTLKERYLYLFSSFFLLNC